MIQLIIIFFLLMPDIVGFLYQVHRRQCLCIEGFEILDGSFINVHPQAMCPQFSHGVFCGIAQNKSPFAK